MSLTEFSAHSNLLERESRMIRAIETGDKLTLDNELIQLDKIQLECLLYGDITAIVEHRTALLSKINAMGDHNWQMQIQVIDDKGLSISEAAELTRSKRHLNNAEQYHQCIFNNLMKFRPWEMLSTRNALGVDEIIRTWVDAGLQRFANPLLTELLATSRHPQDLQSIILDEIKIASERFDSSAPGQSPVITWAKEHQQSIIGLGGNAMPFARSMPYDVIINIANSGLTDIARLALENTQKLPEQGDLYRLRVETGIILDNQKILDMWESTAETDRLTPGKLIALTMYTMAFEDAPIPERINVAEVTAILRRVDCSIRILTECGVEHDPLRASFVLDYWWNTQDSPFSALKSQAWPESFKMACAGYRTQMLERDLGL